MLRSASHIWWMPLVLASLGGCQLDLDFSGLDLFGAERLDPVPRRFALGATAVASIETDDPDPEVWAQDPEVIAVEQIGGTQVRLTAVGVGKTTITLGTERAHKEYEVEVAQHERYEVLLVEQIWGIVPVAEINDSILLAGVPHEILVAFYDGRGLLYSNGLTDFVVPEGSEDCDASVGSFDGRCLILEEGAHVMELDIAGQIEAVSFEAVPEASVANVVLVRDREEAEAREGDRLRIDVLGLTAESEWVYGITSTENGVTSSSPIVYEFDPTSSPEVITVMALDFVREVTIHGRRRFPAGLRHDCYSAGWFSSC